MPATPPSPTPSAGVNAFVPATLISLVLNLVMLVALLPVGDFGVVAWFTIDLAALVVSLRGRHFARAAGLLTGLLLCLVAFIIWLYYSFSHWVAG